MYRKRKLLLVLLSASIILSMNLVFADEKSEVIKIGYIYNYGTIKEPLIQHSEGFGFECFEQISKYTNHEYEYVLCTWEDGLSMLETGEIDIFGPATKTKEREEQFLFTNESFGNEMMTVASLIESEYMYEDVEALNGKRIRVEMGGYDSYYLEKYMEKNNLDLEFIYSNDKSDVEGIKNDLYDLSLTSSLYFEDELKTNIPLKVHPFYYMTNKDNVKLMNAINTAIEEVLMDDLLFFNELSWKYYKNSQVAKSTLCRADIELLKEEITFKVGYNSEYNPIQYLDKDNKPKGVSIKMVELLIEGTGINFEYVPVDLISEEECLDIDIMLDVSGKYNGQNMSQVSLPYLQFEFMSIMKKNVESVKKQEIAMANFYYIPKASVQNIVPNTEIEIYENVDSIIEGLNSGDIAGAFVSELACNAILDQINLAEFSVQSLDVEFPLDMRYADSVPVEYIDVFDKLISRLDKTTVDTVYYDAQRDTKEGITVIEFIVTHVPEVMLISFAFGVAFILMMAKIARQKREALNKIINEDSLTGLLTEYKFIQEVQIILKKSLPNEYKFISLDIDNFKYINEVYGYEKGSLVLKCLSEQLIQYFGDSDLIARTNADNFIIMKKNQSNIDNYDNEKCYRPYINTVLIEILGVNYPLNISQGVYEIADNSLDITYMMDCASSAKLLSKEAYGDVISVFTAAMEEKRRQKNIIINNMEKALSNHEFAVFYQPKIDLHTKKITGAEALVRWISPTEGIIFPDNFIPLFEENGFIKKIDLYVFEDVCRFKAENKGKLQVPIISSNFSNLTLMCDDFVELLLECTRKYDISPTCLELEITESAIAENGDTLINKITELKNLGFLISMDDFGSGVSSLNRLKDIDINILKIDREFLMDTLNGDKGILIIENIINLAKDLQLATIAEGVETKEHVDLLAKLNCDYAQGYYFSKPIAEEAFINLISNPPNY